MIPKYRAWIKSTREMVFVDVLCYKPESLFTDTEILKKAKDGLIYDQHNDIHSFSDIILMSSCGYSNKKGIELFDEDIGTLYGVRYVVDGGYLGAYGWYFNLIARKPRNKKVLIKAIGVLPFVEQNIKEFQLLGNTYENPELLNP